MWMLLTFFAWLDPCSAVYFRLPFLDHLKVFPFIQQNISSACQLWIVGAHGRYIFPLQVALAAGFPLGRASVLRSAHRGLLPSHHSLLVMARPAVCDERELTGFFLCFVISKLLFPKLGHPITLLLQFICLYCFWDFDTNVTLLPMLSPGSLKLLLSSL